MFKFMGRLMQKAAAIAIAALCVSAFADSTWVQNGNNIYNNNSGNVGVGTGTSTLYNKLDVAGNIGLRDNDLHLRASTWSDQSHGLGWYGTGKLWNGINPDGPVLYGYSGGMLGVNHGGTKSNILYWKDTAVGIGTTSPSEKLEVNGNIKCSAVKINGWTLNAPDYVFEKGYKLPSLKDVEKHIAIKKHLPDVPSAAEMKKNGVDLAEMNMALLRKVEELTLYAIDQNKKLEEQQKQIDGLRGLIGK